MTKRSYLIIYMIFCLFLIIHLAIAKLYSEPYPTFIFPGFSKPPRLTDNYQLHISNVYAVDSSNDTLLLNHHNLFGRTRMTHANDMLETVIKKEKFITSSSRETVAIKKNEALMDMLGQRAVSLQIMKKNLKRQYPEKNFTRLLFVHANYVYNFSTKLLSEKSISQQTTVINL